MKTLLIILGIVIGGFVVLTFLAGVLLLCVWCWEAILDEVKDRV